jgi:uncharacterized protein YbbK (DUF523 family)
MASSEKQWNVYEFSEKEIRGKGSMAAVLKCNRMN